jgi:ABC-type glycerol-3-phosphate transport system substrate-binding protein
VQKERKFVHAIRANGPTRTAVALAVAALVAAAGIMIGATVASAAPHPNPHPTPTPTASGTPNPKHSKLDPTKLSISNKVIAHGKHHGDTVTGVLTDEGTGVANEKVTLEARSGVKPRWTVVATGTTGTGGTVSFTVSPKVKTQYELVFAGDSTYKASDSNVITLLRVK